MERPCFLNLNWDDQIDSALSSLVSSPVSNSLSSSLVYNGEISSFQSLYASDNPFNTPPKPNISMIGDLPTNHLDQFCNDPGFAERAARFSSFDARNYPDFVGNVGLPNNPCPKMLNKMQIGAQLGNSHDGSTVSDPASVGNAKKRKAVLKGKAKVNTKTGEEKVAESETKRLKTVESDRTEEDLTKPKIEQNGSETTSVNVNGGNKKDGKLSNKSKQSEPPKDYIHVRARRGQATDSHSLAERVRREKISQRMKLLQDLVPGCNKVTGKAVMLDEIINYVQSLQRQVEFLSMKLATVNPQLDFNVLPDLFPKDIHQICNQSMSSVFPLEMSGAAHCLSNHSFATLESTLCQNINTNNTLFNGISGTSHQDGNLWVDDLQSVVQVEAASSQNLDGQLQEPHMKMEL